jgi:hypothetical protein
VVVGEECGRGEGGGGGGGGGGIFFQDGIRTRWTLSRTVHGFLMLGNVRSFRVEVMR